MYLERSVDRALLEWRNAERFKPLLLRGIRQCGKTSAVRRLAESFDGYIELNFERRPGLKKLFEGDIDVAEILKMLELQFGKRIQEGKTLLFMDEIQECPRAITALRYFYEEIPGLHVIAAGSLLEFVLNGKEKKRVDFPVGRVRSIYMYPFSFREFLTGIGEGNLADYLQALDPRQEECLVHEKLLEAYKTFLIVGGMPEAVSEYVSTGSLLACQQIHRDIVLNFLDDFNKYGSAVPAEMIRKVFSYAMHNVCSQTKASSAIAGVSAYYFDECVQLLRCAGLVYPVKASDCMNISLGASEKETNKKLLVFDTGVYLTERGLNVGDLLAADVFQDMNRGSVVEMETGLELIKSQSHYENAELHYWYKSGANAEIDYAIVRNGAIIPIEVKASSKGSMQSMHAFLKSHERSPYGIRVSLENFAEYENIRVFPVYAVNKIADS